MLKILEDTLSSCDQMYPCCIQGLTRLHQQCHKEIKGWPIINLLGGKLHLAPVNYKHQEKSAFTLSILTLIHPSLSSTKPVEASRHQGAQTKLIFLAEEVTTGHQHYIHKPCGYQSAGPVLMCLKQSRGCYGLQEVSMSDSFCEDQQLLSCGSQSQVSGLLTPWQKSGCLKWRSLSGSRSRAMGKCKKSWMAVVSAVLHKSAVPAVSAKPRGVPYILLADTQKDAPETINRDPMT